MRLRTIGDILAGAVLCCSAIGFLFDLWWHLAMLGLWGSLTLGAVCIGIWAFFRRKKPATPPQ